jgi:Cof subfamily protein (haloacid dehalogenase superfamily)
MGIKHIIPYVVRNSKPFALRGKHYGAFGESMPEPRKIVFLDIDGTLMAHTNHIPRSARKVCRKARENGHRLYIATGRGRSQINASILALGFDGIISSNGAYIESGGQAVFSAFLSPLLLDRLLKYFTSRESEYMLQLPEKNIVSPCFYPRTENIIVSLKSMSKAIFRWSFRRFLESSDTFSDECFDRERVCKLVFMESKNLTFGDVKREFGAVCEIFGNSVPGATGGGELTLRGIHKGSAAEWVARFHGIGRKDTIAIGDGDNDLPMIEYAGVGISMGNGEEKLKKIADDVTDCINRNGLAKAFIKYGLA